MDDVLHIQGFDADQSYRTKFRELLTEYFGAEDLRNLCFSLGVDYDDLPGSGRENKARELIFYIERRGRRADLLAECARMRPHVDWYEEVGRPPSKPPDQREENLFRPGLSVVEQFIHHPQVKKTISTFQTDFRAACEQSVKLAAYKRMHDQLHKLQFTFYNPVFLNSRQFPENETVVETLQYHQLTLESIIREMKVIRRDEAFSHFDTTWIEVLDEAHDHFDTALTEVARKPLDEALWLTKRVLDLWPTRINDRLIVTAQTLRLDGLVEAMIELSDVLEKIGADPAQVKKFEPAVDLLVELRARVGHLLSSHDKWQSVDRELRQIEAQLELGAINLEREWSYVISRVESLYTTHRSKWADDLMQEGVAVDKAIKSGNVDRVRAPFWRFFRRANERFNQVDEKLKWCCEELRQIKDPLTLVLGVVS